MKHKISDINSGIQVKIDSATGGQIDFVGTCTESQSEILTACLIGSDDAMKAFNQSITIHLKGDLSTHNLQNAFKTLINRNESLRTVFDISTNSFLILNDLPILIKEILTNSKQLHFVLQDYIRSEMHFVFNLRKGPLFRVTLISDNEGKNVLVLTLHHVICDGWSLSLLVKELALIFNHEHAQIEGFEPAQRFSDYIEKVQEMPFKEEEQKSERFWTKCFNSYKPKPYLPYDRPQGTVFTYKSGHISFPLDPEIFNKVKKMGQLAQTSVLITMVSLFEVLLYRMSGIKSLVIGIPTAGQPLTGFEKLIGHCVNMLPVLTEIEDDISFLKYLEKRKTEYAEVFNHRHLTFGKLLKLMKYSRSHEDIPLIPVTFNIDRPLFENIEFEGLDFETEINPRAYSSFELIVNISRINTNLNIECFYNEALFDKSTIAGLLSKYTCLINHLSDAPQTILKESLLYDPIELKTKLLKWNKTEKLYPDDVSLNTLFEKQVLLNPNKEALKFKNLSYSYDEINKKANKIANHLVNLKIGKGQFIAVYLDRRPEMVISLIAIMKTGAAYLPLDPLFPVERIKYMLQDSGAKYVLSSKEMLNLKSIDSTVLDFETIINQDSEPKNEENPNVFISPEDLVYLIYTSGSTGTPKGVMIEHKSIINYLWDIKDTIEFSSKDRLLAVTTVSFDIAGFELYLPLILGGVLVLADKEMVKDGNQLIDCIERENITVMQATPATYKLMLASGLEKQYPINLICGGEALALDLALKLVRKCSNLWNVYGPTETTIFSSIKKIDIEDKQITIGKPVANTDILILDSNNALVDEGMIGEICIGGVGLSRGYWNQPTLTNERFITHPLHKNKKIYKTGDLGKLLSSGEIVCLGRNDNQVKIRGYRIEIEEIEHQINSIDGISESVVLAKKFSEDDLRIIAFVVPEDKTSIQFVPYEKDPDLAFSRFEKGNEKIIKQSLLKELPEYMIPFVFININKLPLTPNAKIDRVRLGYVDISTLLIQTYVGSNHAHEEKPWTKLNHQIKAIWQETLGINSIGLNDNFFDLGGHSLIAVQIMNLLQTRLNVNLPLSSLLIYSTINKLSDHINSGNNFLWKYLVPIKTTGTKPPLYLVHGAGLEVMVFNEIAIYLDEDQPVYGIQAMGLMDDEQPAATIEEIAASYIKEILIHNPNGPYALAGFSAGGVIAFEMAKQMKAAGKAISMLGNFDFSLEHLHTRKSNKEKLKNMILELVPRQIHMISCLIKHPKHALKFQKQFLKLRIEGIKNRLRPIKVVDKQLSPNKMFKIVDVYLNALENYIVKPYDGSIDIFNSQIKIYYLKDRKYLGWKPYAQRGVKIHSVEGDHDQMILPPNSKTFARTLQEVINNNNKHKTQNETNTNQNTNSSM